MVDKEGSGFFVSVTAYLSVVSHMHVLFDRRVSESRAHPVSYEVDSWE